MPETSIQINKSELALIRQYLTAQRRGDAYTAHAGEVVEDILRRVGFASSDTIFPDHQRTKGICVVCGCTEHDPCEPGAEQPCAWEPGFRETICDRCANA